MQGRWRNGLLGVITHEGLQPEKQWTILNGAFHVCAWMIPKNTRCEPLTAQSPRWLAWSQDAIDQILSPFYLHWILKLGPDPCSGNRDKPTDRKTWPRNDTALPKWQVLPLFLTPFKPRMAAGAKSLTNNLCVEGVSINIGPLWLSLSLRNCACTRCFCIFIAWQS